MFIIYITLPWSCNEHLKNIPFSIVLPHIKTGVANIYALMMPSPFIFLIGTFYLINAFYKSFIVFL